MNAKNPFHQFLISMYWYSLIILLLLSFIIEKGNEVLLINGNDSDFADYFFTLITKLGDGIVFLPIILGLLFVRFYYCFVGIAIWVSHGLFCAFAKRVLFASAKRPKAILDNDLLHFVPNVDVYSAYSFPSGHTATIFGLAVFLSLVIKNRLVAILLLVIALASGIDLARGTYIVTMDGDLQNDPQDIPMMLEKLKREGWDVVAGFRKNRQDGELLRKIPSKIANYLIRQLSGVHIRDYGCTLKIFKRAIAKNLELYGELHRFIPILAVLQGGKITDVPVHHHPRIHGHSKYGLGRTLKVVSDLLLMTFFQKYFRRPIHLFGPLGLVTFMIGFAISCYLLIVKIMGQDIWGRPLLILGVSLVLAGIQFLTFGLIAELVMRVYYESQNKKTYTIKEIFKGEKVSQEALKEAV